LAIARVPLVFEMHGSFITGGFAGIAEYCPALSLKPPPCRMKPGTLRWRKLPS